MVNGVIGIGCRIFYGVKAVRFVMGAFSQLKYGARLINSFLGDNATISCCEVLNSLIFPAHEQHHNNSFLCAALVMGQSNIPAGATIGSNHNSRAADGEIFAKRGFWPSLCVSLKHNSKFASFTILGKGDYMNELNIPIPFSLVLIDEARNGITVMPAYWFMYNMYALSRNAWKYRDRDRRSEKIQALEYDYLAPDTVNEIFNSLELLEILTGKAFYEQKKKIKYNKDGYQYVGKQLLRSDDPVIDELEITADDFENGKQKTLLIKVRKAYLIFCDMIFCYGMHHILEYMHKNNITSLNTFKKILPEKSKREEWLNIGGQLFTSLEVSNIKNKIRNGGIDSWRSLHNVYQEHGEHYPQTKLLHAIASLQEIEGIELHNINTDKFIILLDKLAGIKQWMSDEIYSSRAKDYSNPYRKMIYDSEEEMNNVLGKLQENTFLIQQKEIAKAFAEGIEKIKTKFKTKDPTLSLPVS